MALLIAVGPSILKSHANQFRISPAGSVDLITAAAMAETLPVMVWR
jgi:hypothetical protein